MNANASTPRRPTDRKQLRDIISDLLETMQDRGENDMGHLSFAEAGLFHAATENITYLLQSLDSQA